MEEREQLNADNQELREELERIKSLPGNTQIFSKFEKAMEFLEELKQNDVLQNEALTKLKQNDDLELKRLKELKQDQESWHDLELKRLEKLQQNDDLELKSLEKVLQNDDLELKHLKELKQDNILHNDVLTNLKKTVGNLPFYIKLQIEISIFSG